MKLANYATIVVLATFPHFCAGQGSVRVSSKPPPFLNDADAQAMASLDSLFEKLSDGHHRRLSDTSLFSEKLLTGIQEKLDVVRTDASKKGASKKVDPGYDIDEDKYGTAVEVVDSLKDSIAMIQACTSGECTEDQVTAAAFAILGTVGMAVGIAFPPAGAVIAAVVAIGSLIASIFASAPINLMPGLDAAAVEGAAFRAVQRVQDTGTFAGFADFTKTLRLANQFNSDLLTKMNKYAVDEDFDDIIDEWFDQYHSYKWGDIVSRMKDVGEDLFSAYGNIAGSRRGAFTDWVKNSNTTCTLEYYLKKGQLGRDNLNRCKEKMAVAKTNYDYVEMFGRHFISLANSLTAYSTIVESILVKHSTCNDDKNDKIPTLGNFACDYYISYSALKSEINDSIMDRARHLKNTIIGKDNDGGITKTCEEPVSKALWPWNQKCGSVGTRCNYKYLIFMSQTDQESTLNGCEGDGCKLLVKEMGDADDVKEKCEQELTHAHSTEELAFYGGMYGWDGSGPPTKVKHSVHSCGETVMNAVDKDFNNDISMIAIPGYSLEIPDCVALFEDPQNFGIIGAVNQSIAAVKIKPTCKDTADTLYSIFGKNGGDWACWQEEISLCDVVKQLDDPNPNPNTSDIIRAVKELISPDKPAKELGWNRKWYSGEGLWKRETVEKKSCTERENNAFDADDKLPCESWDFNWKLKGCMYD